MATSADRSNGPISSTQVIVKLAQAITDAKPQTAWARDMATFALRAPEAFLARPQWQRELVSAAVFTATVDPNMEVSR